MLHDQGLLIINIDSLGSIHTNQGNKLLLYVLEVISLIDGCCYPINKCSHLNKNLLMFVENWLEAGLLSYYSGLIVVDRFYRMGSNQK